MSQVSVDVLVAGGGPGGLAAAEAAARGGCSVLVLEAGKEIGSPTRTSGGSFIAELKALGIPDHLFKPPARPVNGCYHVRRPVLSAALQTSGSSASARA